MVNSFLVHSDLYTSARYLDHSHQNGHHPRLNNQCREAIMMINYLDKIDFIAQLFNVTPIPTYQPTDSIEHKLNTFLQQVAWTKGVLQMYKEYRQEHNIEIAVGLQGWRWVPYKNSDYLQPDEKTILNGYVNHPATLAWAGHLNALKHYCNVHRAVSIERDFNVKIGEYNIQHPVQYPWWIDNDILHASYRNNLIWKEITRNEPPWYTTMDYFNNIVQHPIYGCGNLWLAKLDYDTLLLIATNQITKLNFWQICDKPNYSQAKSDIKVVEQKDQPGKNGWCLYQIYSQPQIPTIYRTAAKYWLTQLPDCDQSIITNIKPSIKIKVI